MKGRHIDIMGIVNLTDDSFYPESRCNDTDAVLERVAQMISEGADIIDFGACSSRPGAGIIGPDAEWERLGPVLTAVRARWPELRISIDTTWASVVERACDVVGDFIVNDISSGADDPGMLATAARLNLTYIAMHRRGTPQTMQQMTDYDDLIEDVKAFFREFSSRAEAVGLKNWILDPGFGFAKTTAQNYMLMKNLRKLKMPYSGGRIPQLMVGVSRKSMIYRTLDISPEQALPQTQVLHLKALQEGADILRVHDVAEAVRTVEVYWRLC